MILALETQEICSINMISISIPYRLLGNGAIDYRQQTRTARPQVEPTFKYLAL